MALLASGAGFAPFPALPSFTNTVAIGLPLLAAAARAAVMSFCHASCFASIFCTSHWSVSVSRKDSVSAGCFRLEVSTSSTNLPLLSRMRQSILSFTWSRRTATNGFAAAITLASDSAPLSRILQSCQVPHQKSRSTGRPACFAIFSPSS